jgi:hypothetical protein
MLTRLLLTCAFISLAQVSLATPSEESLAGQDDIRSAVNAADNGESDNEPPRETITLSEAEAIRQALQVDSADADLNIAAKPPVVPTNTGRGGVANMNPEIALIFDVAGAYFSDAESGQLGAHDPAKTGFTLQQLEMHAESRVDPYFDFQTNLVFSEFGVEVEEVYAQTLSMPYALQIKAGQFLLPYGRANPTHPHSWHFLDQTLMLGKFMGGEGGRGLGAEISWLTPLPWYAKITIGVSQPSGECCARSYFSPINPPINGLEDFIYFSRLEQFWELGLDWGMLVGTSQLVGENKTGIGNLSLLTGGDVMIRYRPMNSSNRRSVQLQLEWTHRSRQVPQDVLVDQGGYAELVVKWSPQWDQGVRHEVITGVAGDPQDLDWAETRQRTSAQISWFPSHFSRLRWQVGYDQMPWRSAAVWSAIMGFEVIVGAHGAHGY